MARLRDEKYEYIKKKVVRTILECDINELPINPFAICNKRKYKSIKYSDKYSVDELELICKVYPDGFNYYLDGERIIEYNDLLAPERIRMTLFHEIGHIELKHTCKCSLSEAEAEWFAAYMIAPPPLVDLINIDSFLDLAIKFDTSITCAYHCMRRYILWKRFTIVCRDYEKKLREQFSH